MKKFTFLLVLLFYVTYSYAQLGVRAGFNFASLSGSTLQELDRATGFQVGLTYSVALSNKLAVRPGVLYSVKGFSAEIFTDIDFRTAYNYIEIPVDLVFSVFDALSFGIDIHAGPYLAYMLNATFTDGGFKEDIEFENSGLTRTDIGLNLGGTVDFSKIYVGINYGLGLDNLSTEEVSGDMEFKNSNLSLIAGYTF